MKTEDCPVSAKPKPPIPPKPILKLSQQRTSQTTPNTGDSSVGQIDTSKNLTKVHQPTTSRVSGQSSRVNGESSKKITPETKKPVGAALKHDKHIVRVESTESTDETCCSSLAHLICYKGPKAVARQVADKPKPPAKPPKPSYESLSRARAARRSIGDEIPAGKEGLKYVDDTSTESSADYKDVFFDEHRFVPEASNRDPNKSSPTGDVNLADWEPLETSSRQSDHLDYNLENDVFAMDTLPESKTVTFSPSEILNASFGPLEAINYAVKDPVTSSENPATVRHSWPRRTKQKKVPPKRPPPPKNYHRVHVYYSLSDDEGHRVELSPEVSPIFPRSALSNRELSTVNAEKARADFFADVGSHSAKDKLSFYPYAATAQSHFMKADASSKTDIAAAVHPIDAKLGLNPDESKILIQTKKPGVSPIKTPRKHSSHSLREEHGLFQKTISQPESITQNTLAGIDVNLNLKEMQPEYLNLNHKSRTVSASWPRRTKPTPPVRPPPPQFDKLGLTTTSEKNRLSLSSCSGLTATAELDSLRLSSHSDSDKIGLTTTAEQVRPGLRSHYDSDKIGLTTTADHAALDLSSHAGNEKIGENNRASRADSFIKPPRPPPPQSTISSKYSDIAKSPTSPDAPPRIRKKRSRTVEVTPSVFNIETTGRQRSHSLNEDPLSKEKTLIDRKSLYTAIFKDPDRKKKPVEEPQIYDRMRFRPLPAPPPPPRKISKGKLDALSLKVASESDLMGNNSIGIHLGNKNIENSRDLPDLLPADEKDRTFATISGQDSLNQGETSDVMNFKAEILKQYALKHSRSFGNSIDEPSQIQVQDNISVDDGSQLKDKGPLERYETVHNLHKEIDSAGNCYDSSFQGDDKQSRLCDNTDMNSGSQDLTKERQLNLGETSRFVNNDCIVNHDHTGNCCLDQENNCDSNINLNLKRSDQFSKESSTHRKANVHKDHPKVELILQKGKKLEDHKKHPEKVGSPRLLRKEDILSSYGVLKKEEIIPRQTIGEMLANHKQDLLRQESTQSTQSAGGDEGDEKEVFAIEVFVSSDAQSTKENSRDTSMEVQSLENSYCVDENANTTEAAKRNSRAETKLSDNKPISPKSSAKKSKTKLKRASQSTFYCPADSEERSRSSSPHGIRAGDDSEVSGNIADVDSSAGSSGRNSAEREEGKRRNSTFYTDIPIKLEKSVQTLPPEIGVRNEDDKSEDTDELMDIARDIKKELSLIIERHNKVKDSPELVPRLGVHLSARKAVSSTQSSASEISCQGSSAESDYENDNLELKKERKLFFIAREIMTSEESFVNALRLLNEDFREVVEDASKEKGFAIVPDDVLNTIFRFLPQLQNLNQSLLEEIKERIDDWQQLPKIADVLVKVGPFLKLYSCYIREFETMTTCLDEACRKHPLFGLVVKDFEASPRCHKLALKHYLLKPVQRIPQYRLLLQDYLNHLPPDSIDYEDTTRALQIVSEVANHANETMKQGDNFLKLMSIQNSLLTTHEIIKPGRIFLKEGELLKLSRKGNQPRFFILFSDSLLYLTAVQQGIFRVNHELPLTGMRVSVPMQTDYQNEFSVISVTRSFSLAARTPEDREEWITALTRAIEENAVKRSSFINIQMQLKGTTSYEQSDFILGKQAPVWIPDSRVTMCQLCTTEFTITYRRHHCRACGRVVCSQCSANRAFLKYLDRRAARVCDNCFLKLQEEEEANKHKMQLSESESEPTPPMSRGPPGKQKRPRRYLPSVLKEVCANDQGSTISGYLHRLSKKRWKRYWFVLKDKVLYTYKASEDVAAKESVPVLGYTVETFNEPIENVDPKLVFQLHHPNQPFIFYAETVGNAERWVKAMKEATVLE